MKLENLVNNKITLYIVLFLAISNIIGYLALNQYNALTLFVVVGILSTYFTKNMVYTLLIALVVTNLMVSNSIVEGMTHGKKKDSKKANKEGLRKKTHDKEGMKGEEHAKKECKGAECGHKTKEKFTQNNIPSSRPAAATEEEEDEALGKEIDYASTMENAYDNLQSIMGDKGMSGLTEETQKLVDQQKELMKTLETMTPVLNSAQKVMNSMDISSLTDSIGSISGIFGGKKQK